MIGSEAIARAEALRTDGDDLASAIEQLAAILVVPAGLVEVVLDEAAERPTGVERVLARCRADLAAEAAT